MDTCSEVIIYDFITITEHKQSIITTFDKDGRSIEKKVTMFLCSCKASLSSPGVSLRPFDGPNNIYATFPIAVLEIPKKQILKIVVLSDPMPNFKMEEYMDRVFKNLIMYEADFSNHITVEKCVNCNPFTFIEWCNFNNRIRKMRLYIPMLQEVLKTVKYFTEETKEKIIDYYKGNYTIS